jgi:hypothetical protein
MISVVIAIVGMVIFFAIDPESRIIFGPVWTTWQKWSAERAAGRGLLPTFVNTATRLAEVLAAKNERPERATVNPRLSLGRW